MAIEIEIVEPSSIIVVTLTGGTDIGALQLLDDALQMAANEKKTVVLDIRELTHASPPTGIIDALGSVATTLKIVASPSVNPNDRPVGYPEVYTSVDAAIESVGAADGELSDNDLVTKFDDLSARYEQMINTCRQLLDRAENHEKLQGRSSSGP